MAEPTKPPTDWREQLAAIGKQLSATELKLDFAKLYVKPLQPLAAAMGQSSEALQKVGSIRLPQGSLKGLQDKGQTPEYQRLFTQMVDPQGALSKGILSQIGPAFAQFQSTAWEDSWTELSKVVAEGMKRAHDALERVELLAALGWTLPMEMSLPEFHALVMQDDLTVYGVDKWFLDYYSRDDGAEFKSLKNNLLESGHLAFWKPLLEQVFDAFSRDQFAVCVPSLLSVLEGSIAVPWDVAAFHKERCRKEFFEQRLSAALPDSINQFQWKSVAAFVQTVFAGVDPNREYSLPKRNLILHGKCNPAKWDRADCLRLFQAIDTVLSLGGELGEGGSEAASLAG